MTTVKRPDGTVIGDVNEHASLLDMERACPVFFRNSHGSRETYTVYRGCVIVRHTVKFTGCNPTRRTVVYLFFPGGLADQPSKPDMLCCSSGQNFSRRNGIDQAKRLIDEILDGGTYNENM